MWFALEQVLNQRCIIVPLLSNIFAMVMHIAYAHFDADIHIMDPLQSLRKNTEREIGGCSSLRASPGNVTIGLALR